MTNTDDKWVVLDYDHARVHIHDTRESAITQLGAFESEGIETAFYPPDYDLAFDLDDVEVVEE